jgi:hypothetical protein
VQQYYSSIGEAIGAAMAHNARQATRLAEARAAEDAAHGRAPAAEPPPAPDTDDNPHC